MIFTKDKSFYKSLVKLAIPIALQNLITFSVTLADNVMVGTLGDTAISGVYIGSQIQVLLQIIIAGIEGALLVIAAQYRGKQDSDSMRKVTAIALRTAAIVGITVSVLCLIIPHAILSLFSNEEIVIAVGIPYLRITATAFLCFCLSQCLIASMRAVEKAGLGMIVSLISLTVNVSLNYLLIFGKAGFPVMGVKGAAIATAVSRAIEFLFIFVYVFFIDKELSFRFSSLFAPAGRLIKTFFKYGTPIMAGQIVWAINTFAYSAIMGKLDYDGVIAALSVVGNLNSLSYIVMNGLSGAVGILIGKTIGSGKTDKIREYAYTVQAIFLLLGLLTGAAIQLLKNPFISLYDISPAAIAESRSLINVLSVTIIGTCYQAACLFGLVKSGGDVAFVMKNDAFFVFVVIIPSALLAQRLGALPWVVFLLLKSDQILKCFVAAVKINRFKWMKNLTVTNERNPA